VVTLLQQRKSIAPTPACAAASIDWNFDKMRDKIPPRCGNRPIGLFRELGNPFRQPRHFAAGSPLVNDAALRRTHDRRFGILERRERCGAVP
jgi:hypothetical protein